VRLSGCGGVKCRMTIVRRAGASAKTVGDDVYEGAGLGPQVAGWKQS
jgi:hypothetical protein